MKRLLFLSISASLVCIAAPSFSKEAQILVEPQPETQQWLENIASTLDKRMGAGTRSSTDRMRDGVVQIRFESSPDGRPANARYLSRSGNMELDRAAWRAVAGLRSLNELPAEYAGRRVFQANIVSASSERSYQRQLQVLDGREAARRLAYSGEEAEVLAINTVNRPAG